MSEALEIGIIGDFNARNYTHVATNDALKHAAAAVSTPLNSTWVATSTLLDGSRELVLERFDALLCAPGSPYVSMDGALAGIRFARERRRPFLGTCGGFQHAVIEYARNALGIADAEHAETAPDAAALVISRMSCSLVGKAQEILFDAGSGLAALYGANRACEQFHCNFGVNPTYKAQLFGQRLHAVGHTVDGEIRAIELEGHPFFIGTLFIPQLSSTEMWAHPILLGFVRAAKDFRQNRSSSENAKAIPYVSGFTLTVRAATCDDLPAILEIYNEAVLNTTASYDYEPRTLEHRIAWFEDHARNNYPVFVATGLQGRILGWSSLSRFHDRMGYRFTAENSIYVAAERRGRGIGKALMRPLIEAAPGRGIHAIIAVIDAANEASIRLHDSFGFESVGLFKQTGFKFGRWLDVVYMELLLPRDLPLP